MFHIAACQARCSSYSILSMSLTFLCISAAWPLWTLNNCRLLIHSFIVILYLYHQYPVWRHALTLWLWNKIFRNCHLARNKFFRFSSLAPNKIFGFSLLAQNKIWPSILRRPPTVCFIFWKKYWFYVKWLYIFFVENWILYKMMKTASR